MGIFGLGTQGSAVVIAAIIAAGATTITAIAGFVASIMVSGRATESSTQNVLLQLQEAQAARLWEARSSVYVGFFDVVTWHTMNRQWISASYGIGQPLPGQTPESVQQMLNTYRVPGSQEFNTKVHAYATDEAQKACLSSGTEFWNMTRALQDYQAAPPESEAAQAARQTLEEQFQVSRKADDELEAVARKELQGPQGARLPSTNG